MMKTPYDRIMIFGLPGSGKSIFATKLARVLNLPIYHLDKHFYLENWVERDPDEFLEDQKEIVDQPRWVTDGNAMRSLEMRFQRADVAIYFRYPLFLCLWRIMKRVLQKDWHLPDLAEGCTKSVRFKLIRYMFRYHQRYLPMINQLREKYPHVQFYVFRSDREADLFLHTIKSREYEKIDSQHCL